jgi:hypothetical protein
MDFYTESFRHGLRHIGDENTVWEEFKSVIDSTTADEINEAKIQDFKNWMGYGHKQPKSPHVGGQPLINQIFDSKLKELGWRRQIKILPEVSYWTMDFKKEDIGVEVSFNNAGVLAQNLLRLSVLSENPNISEKNQIRLGVLVTATEKLKKWCNMDSTVLTFETVNRVMPIINFNIPTPIILIGVDASTNGTDWNKTKYFGHKKLTKFDELSLSEQKYWRDLIDG